MIYNTTTRISGELTLKNNNKIQIVTQESQGDPPSGTAFPLNCVKTEDLCYGSEFHTGAFNASSITLKIAISPNFSGEFLVKEVALSSQDENYTAEIGTFYIDNSKSKRTKNIVTLEGYDAALKFDKEIELYMGDWGYSELWELPQVICDEVGQDLFGGYVDGLNIDDIPNAHLKVLEYLYDPDSKVEFPPEIQTFRDFMIWVLRAIGCYARVNPSDNKVYIYSYLYNNPETYWKEIPPEERDGQNLVAISDARAVVRAMQMYKGDENKVYKGSIKNPEQFAFGVLFCPKNPLLSHLDLDIQDEINKEIVEYFDTFAQREVKLQVFDGAVYNVGDRISLDDGIISVRKLATITKIVWRWRNKTTIYCQSLPISSDGSESTLKPSNSAKTRIEKRIDGLEKAIGNGGGDYANKAVFFTNSSSLSLAANYALIAEIPFAMTREGAAIFRMHGFAKEFSGVIDCKFTLDDYNFPPFGRYENGTLTYYSHKIDIEEGEHSFKIFARGSAEFEAENLKASVTSPLLAVINGGGDVEYITFERSYNSYDFNFQYPDFVQE